MSLYTLISSLLSYIFTTIIYLFILSIIVLIYRDIKRMSQNNYEEEPEDDEYDTGETSDTDEENSDSGEIEYTAILKKLKPQNSAEYGIKSKYRIGSGEPIVIGRGENCDITADDLYLSQEHFMIECVDGEWYITDLKSKNGTYVNGNKIKKTKRLEDGDVISFGDIQFEFQSE